MTVKIRNMTIDDIKYYADHGYDIPDQFVNIMFRILNGGIAMTCLVDDQIACSAGLFHIFSKTALAWMFVTPLIKKAGFSVYKNIKIVLNTVMSEKIFDRIQCEIRCSDNTAIHFVEKLGFQREGRLRSYKNGEDYFMYSIVRR